VFFGAVISTVVWALAPPLSRTRADGENVTIRPEGENAPVKLTFPLKYPIDVTVNVMSVLEL
jgi:hypothetical protein